MSAPAAKALSLPVMTIAPIASAASNGASASPSSFIRESLSAFSTLARFSVTRPTRPRVSTRMFSGAMRIPGRRMDDGTIGPSFYQGRPARPALLEGDFPLADHPAPALDLRAYPAVELSRRAARGLQALVGEALPYFRLCENSGHFRVDTRHDFGRRPRRSEQRDPGLRDKPSIRLAHRGHAGRDRAAMLGGDRKRAQPPGPVVGTRARHGRKHRVHLGADQIAEREPRPFVRHHGDVDSRLDLEQLHQQARGQMSARPPVAFGTMIRTGLAGYACPKACGRPAAARIARASAASTWR